MDRAFIKEMRNDEHKENASSRTFMYGEEYFLQREEVNRSFMGATL
jgi:hypothetical protein